MRTLRRIIGWSLLCIILEVGVFLYLENSVFKHSSDFTLKDYKSEKQSKETNFNIPKNAEDIKISYDGSYLTYKYEGAFKLVTCSDGKETTVKSSKSSGQVLYINWLKDRNRLMIAEKIVGESGGNVINLLNLDPKSNKETIIKEICSYKEGMSIGTLITATLPGVSYITVEREGYTTCVYRVDINNKLEKINNIAYSINNISIFPHKDEIIYKDDYSGRFYSYSNLNTKKTGIYDSSMQIIKLNNDDTIYMAKLLNDKAISIYSGTEDQDISQWNCMELDKPKDLNDIYVNDLGEILVADDLKGIVHNYSEDTDTKYKGTLISINEKVICSKEGNKIHIKSIIE